MIADNFALVPGQRHENSEVAFCMFYDFRNFTILRNTKWIMLVYHNSVVSLIQTGKKYRFIYSLKKSLSNVSLWR